MKINCPLSCCLGFAIIALCGCAASVPAKSDSNKSATAATHAEPSATDKRGAAAFDWPASVAAFGDGYPNAGDSCRKLGESSATIDYLDHTQTLIGCPGTGQSTLVISTLVATSGKLVGQVDGVSMISFAQK